MHNTTRNKSANVLHNCKRPRNVSIAPSSGRNRNMNMNLSFHSRRKNSRKKQQKSGFNRGRGLLLSKMMPVVNSRQNLISTNIWNCQKKRSIDVNVAECVRDLCCLLIYFVSENYLWVDWTRLLPRRPWPCPLTDITDSTTETLPEPVSLRPIMLTIMSSVSDNFTVLKYRTKLSKPSFTMILLVSLLRPRAVVTLDPSTLKVLCLRHFSAFYICKPCCVFGYSACQLKSD